jgi:hypothetical protein
MSDDNVTEIHPTGASGLPSFRDALARKGSPDTIRAEISKAFSDPELWAKVEPLLALPGLCGSRQFDHAFVVRELLDWDKQRNHKRIEKMKLAPFALWRQIAVVLKKVYEMRGGRIVGALEFDGHESTSNVA